MSEPDVFRPYLAAFAYTNDEPEIQGREALPKPVYIPQANL